VIVDLFLSYRAVKAWDDMIRLAARMPRPLTATVMVQEQLGLALNRAGRGEEAERVLLDLLRARGPSSETYGILGLASSETPLSSDPSHTASGARIFCLTASPERDDGPATALDKCPPSSPQGPGVGHPLRVEAKKRLLAPERPPVGLPRWRRKRGV
jgi:hypothetical protein